MTSQLYTSRFFRDPDSFLKACGDRLVATRAVAANFPLATTYRITTEGTFKPHPESVWAAVSTSFEPNAPDPLFAVTLTGPGHRTALASSVDPAALTPEARTNAMAALARAFDQSGVPTTAVHSAVGPRVLAEPFASSWAMLRGVMPTQVPRGHFYLTAVTEDMLRPPSRPDLAGLEVRRPKEEDMDKIARICFDLAAPGAHAYAFVDDAMVEAKWLFSCECLWTCVVNGEPQGITSVKRRSPGVHSISTVWTEPDARGRGVAEAMVRAVCRSVFDSGTKSACLCFDPSNPIANRLYGRLGFLGVEKSEEWMEVGLNGRD